MSKKVEHRIKRFNIPQRVFHVLLMISFLIQASTGLARMYIQTDWGQGLSWVFGGYGACLIIHRYVGIFMILGFIVHTLYLFS